MGKQCTTCRRELELQCFTKRAASNDGLSYTCRDCASSKAKARYVADPEKHKIKALEWAKSNRDARRQIGKRWEKDNAERCRSRKREAARSARAKNPEKARLAGRIAAQARRHRTVAASAAPSKAVVARLMRIAAGRCTYCRSAVSGLTIDHFQPVSKGGTGQWWNLAPCCQPCNSSKRDADGPTWIEKKFGLQRLVEVHWLMETLAAARLP